MEEEFHDKNIAFVSISVDVDQDFEKWKNFVSEKQLGGIQLFADKNWNSDFIKSFSINSIPRFILIDPNGKVVHSDASRPSSPELKEELGKLVK
jgi:alkyl hydroperoxide reductase subunit AhpC